jgi:tetratricopeptide (TPR) repeat protein
MEGPRRTPARIRRPRARSTPRRTLLFSAANHNPKTRTEAYFQAGSICYQLQQYSQATLLLRQVLEWQPDHPDALRLLAASWYDIGAMEKAIQTLREVSRIAPADYRPIYMQATILRDFERFEDAALAFVEAAEKAPANSTVAREIHAEWGDCLIQLRRWEQALAVLQKAGDWPDVLALRAQAMFSLRRFDEASALANQALTHDPTQPDAALVAAAASERRNQIDNGLQLLNRCLQKHPFDLRLHNRTAELLAAVNRTAEAEQFRRQAAEIARLRAQLSSTQQELVRDSSNVEKRLEIAAVAEQLGELKTAEQWLRAAVGMAPELPAANAALQQFLQKHPPTTDNTATPGNTVTNSPVTNATEF